MRRSSRALNYAVLAVQRGLYLGVVALLIASSCKRSPERLGTESTPAASETTPMATQSAEDGDAVVIEQLRASGSDLTKPIIVDLYLYFPKEPGANSVAEAMRSDGYTVEVRAPRPSIPDWACIAKKSLMVTPAVMREVRARLTALAKQAGGEYDGWEAAVTH